MAPSAEWMAGQRQGAHYHLMDTPKRPACGARMIPGYSWDGRVEAIPSINFRCRNCERIRARRAERRGNA